jgi:oligopeptide transport system ATP-binding protein
MIGDSRNVENTKPLLEVRRLGVQYPLRGRWSWSAPGSLRAVEEVNFNLHAGETLGIVGESGSGKSTLARALVGLQPVSSGAITFDGSNIAQLDPASWRPLRRDIQIVFQDPLASLDPRMSIGRIVAEPLQALRPGISAAEREEMVSAMLERVGLSRLHVNRYPHEFSGGQCQRVGIARALIVRPKLLVCDEPVSALDVSVQAQIINLLKDLQREYGLAMIFIAHDLAVVRHISHRVLVMYMGRMMEQADRDTLFAAPAHPYTKALLAAIPSDDPVHIERRQRQMLEGEIPSPANPPPGCVFATRCPMADEHCGRQVPHVRRLANGTVAACHYLAAT